MEARDLKSLNCCKAYAHVDQSKKSHFIISDLVLYQPGTNSFEVRFSKDKMTLFAADNQPQVITLSIDDISCKKGDIRHLITHSFSVASIRNVGYERIELDGVNLEIKINKYCTTKIKQGNFNSCLYRKISQGIINNKENINTVNLNRVEVDIDTDKETLKLKKQSTAPDGDYDESEVEEGTRFSQSKARKRSSSLISKKTPRNSNIKIEKRRPTPMGIDNIINKKMKGFDKIFRAPSTQKSERSYRSSFSHYTSNGAVSKNDFSTCGIPKPKRFSFRSTDTKSQVIDNSQGDKYALLKSDYESLKDELAKRNATILMLQNELKDFKEKFTKERKVLHEKLDKAAVTNDDYKKYRNFHIFTYSLALPNFSLLMQFLTHKYIGTRTN